MLNSSVFNNTATTIQSGNFNFISAQVIDGSLVLNNASRVTEADVPVTSVSMKCSRLRSVCPADATTGHCSHRGSYPRSVRSDLQSRFAQDLAGFHPGKLCQSGTVLLLRDVWGRVGSCVAGRCVSSSDVYMRLKTVDEDHAFDTCLRVTTHLFRPV